MVVTKRGQMPDGTKIQIEDWKAEYPGIHDTFIIAAYPKAKNTGKYSWVRKGETFRLELSRGFKTDEYVIQLFEKLFNGAITLEELDDHYWNGDKDRYYMGLRERED